MLPEIDFSKIGARVKSARLRKGYSQAVLAEKIDCSNNYISHIETGQTSVSLKILMQISYVTEQPLDFFLVDTPYVSNDYILNSEIGALLVECKKPTIVAAKRMIEILREQEKEMEKELLY